MSATDFGSGIGDRLGGGASADGDGDGGGAGANGGGTAGVGHAGAGGAGSAPFENERRLRPVGWGRYFDGAFLLAWLTGWLFGEVFALAVLAALFSHALSVATGFDLPLSSRMNPPDGSFSFFLLFILFWLMLWTLGGAMAGTQLFRSLTGEDRIRITPDGLEIERRTFGIGRRRTIARGTIRRLYTRTHDRTLVADTPAGPIAITKFGKPGDRESLRVWLRQRLALPSASEAKRLDRETPPHDWEVVQDGVDLRMSFPTRRDRRISAGILWGITAILASGWIGTVPRMQSPRTETLVSLGLSLLMAAFASWCTWGRSEWLVRNGRMTKRRRFASSWSSRPQVFEQARLEIDHSVDSDGDARYELSVRTDSARRKITSSMYDDGDIIRFGEWLSARTGFHLDR
jgi:hypothetical protein